MSAPSSLTKSLDEDCSKDAKPKRKRRSRLSLNGDTKSKDEGNKSGNNITSFFQKLSPKVQNGSNLSKQIDGNQAKHESNGNKENIAQNTEKAVVAGSEENEVHNLELSSVEPKVKNAFTFMMDNRNKVIGQNSPGREQPVEESAPPQKDAQKKLSSRKQSFQEWANARGRLKRKLEDEEIGITIEHKLKKRAKNLKKMLTKKSQESSEDDDDKEEVVVAYKKRRKTRVIHESDSESEVFADHKKRKLQVIEDESSQQADLFNFLKTPCVINPKTPSKETAGFSNGNSSLSGENGEVLNKASDGTYTPRSYKRWQMKLKINLDDINEEEAIILISPQKFRNCQVVCSSGSDSDEPLASKTYYKSNRQQKPTKPVKFAPIFTKSFIRPKIDAIEKEARRKFLHSGIPDELKKSIEKQQRSEIHDYPIFPTITHVTAKPDEELKHFWNLPPANLHLNPEERYTPPELHWSSFNTTQLPSAFKHDRLKLQKITTSKSHLDWIKSENPSYPVYRTFKILQDKHTGAIKIISKPPEAPKKLKRGRPRKKLPPETKVVQLENVNKEIWTDLYKPVSSGEIYGNRSGVVQIKKWLEDWLEFSDEMQRSGKRRRDSGSSTEFEGIDESSRDGVRISGNTLLLCGPCGSGKTTTVYALCNELNMNVIELNASSKRTGKRLLQELQEATQSHQVPNQQSNHLSAYFKKDETKSENENPDKRMCLLLIEDVDIVFEQDESFIGALTQLLSTSKRPIILTTTDANCLHLKKFFVQNTVVRFAPYSLRALDVWLQIICLVEGWFVDKTKVGELLDCNKGDIRRTLLQLQFLVLSCRESGVGGGDVNMAVGGVMRDDGCVTTVVSAASSRAGSLPVLVAASATNVSSHATSLPVSGASSPTSVASSATSTSSQATSLPTSAVLQASASSQVASASSAQSLITLAPCARVPTASVPSISLIEAPTTAVSLTEAPQTAVLPTAALQSAAPPTAVPLTAASPTNLPSTAAESFTAVPPTAAPSTAAPPTAAPSTAVPPTAAPPTAAPSTAVPPTAAPPTAAPSTAAPSTAAPSTAVPSTAAPPTAAPSTAAPSTAVPPTAAPLTAAASTAAPSTAVPPTAASSTAVPPSAVPPSAVPPSAVPPTAAPPTAALPTAVPPTAPPPNTSQPTSDDRNTNLTDLIEKEGNTNTTWLDEETTSASSTLDYNDLGTSWWNIPRVTKLEPSPDNETAQETNSDSLRNIAQIFETLATTYVSNKKLKFLCDFESAHKLNRSRLKDSLDLSESLLPYSACEDLHQDISCALLTGYTKLTAASDSSSSITSVDSSLEIKSWSSKQYKCREALLEAVPVSSRLDGASLGVDYLTTLRTIARAESVREKCNTKRRNRFYNYLRGLGVNCYDSTLQNACSAFGRK